MKNFTVLFDPRQNQGTVYDFSGSKFNELDRYTRDIEIAEAGTYPGEIQEMEFDTEEEADNWLSEKTGFHPYIAPATKDYSKMRVRPFPGIKK